MKKYGNEGRLYHIIAWMVRHHMSWLGHILANRYYKEL